MQAAGARPQAGRGRLQLGQPLAPGRQRGQLRALPVEAGLVIGRRGATLPAQRQPVAGSAQRGLELRPRGAAVERQLPGQRHAGQQAVGQCQCGMAFQCRQVVGQRGRHAGGCGRCACCGRGGSARGTGGTGCAARAPQHIGLKLAGQAVRAALPDRARRARPPGQRIEAFEAALALHAPAARLGTQVQRALGAGLAGLQPGLAQQQVARAGLAHGAQLHRVGRGHARASRRPQAALQPPGEPGVETQHRLALRVAAQAAGAEGQRPAQAQRGRAAVQPRRLHAVKLQRQRGLRPMPMALAAELPGRALGVGQLQRQLGERQALGLARRGAGAGLQAAQWQAAQVPGGRAQVVQAQLQPRRAVEAVAGHGGLAVQARDRQVRRQCREIERLGLQAQRGQRPGGKGCDGGPGVQPRWRSGRRGSAGAAGPGGGR